MGSVVDSVKTRGKATPPYALEDPSDGLDYTPSYTEDAPPSYPDGSPNYSTLSSSTSYPAASRKQYYKPPSLAGALLEREGLGDPGAFRTICGKLTHTARAPSWQWPQRFSPASPAGHGRSPSCTARLPSWSSSTPRRSLPSRTAPKPRSHTLLSHTPVSSPRSWKNSQSLWLSLYFTANLALTLYNKSVLINFPYPYALTAVHCLSGTIGTMVCAWLKVFKPPRLTRDEKVVIVMFSFLYSINIVVSNLSLGLVSIPVHQVVRALTPIFTLAISMILLSKRPTRGKVICLIPVMLGVGFATYGDYNCTLYGFLLTILGTILAALKTVLTNVLQTPRKNSMAPARDNKSEKLPAPSTISSPSKSVQLPVSRTHTLHFPRPTISLDPMSLLYVLSPIAFAECMLLSWMTGEWDQVVTALVGKDGRSIRTHSGIVSALALNGCIAFMLNVVSFGANKRVGAVGMSVAANVKQALTILLAVVIFDFMITPLNVLGISLTLIGGALYAWVELAEKQRRKALQEGASTARQ
ncbi:triose-phosphate transporter family-domain-containing protein [Schizophyllum commune]